MPKGKNTKHDKRRQVGREIYEQRMAGASLHDMAKKYKMSRQEVRQAELSHMHNPQPYCEHCGANENHPDHPMAPEHWSSYDPNFYPPEY